MAVEIAQCDLWFPPISLPVGFGQTRRPAQLPVLTMVPGYSRWLSAVLIPTRRSEDLFTGWWQLIEAGLQRASPLEPRAGPDQRDEMVVRCRLATAVVLTVSLNAIAMPAATTGV